MGKWILLAVKDEKTVIPVASDTGDPALYETFEDAEDMYRVHPFGQMFPGWALNIETGDTEPI